MESIDFLAREPESSHFCRTFVKSEYSPEGFDDLRHQYRLGCKWRKELANYLSTIKKEEIPLITFDDIPVVTFNDPVLNETVIWLKEQLDNYKYQLEVLSETKKAAQKGEWESRLMYFAPFLICIALSLRITKVTGELRYET